MYDYYKVYGVWPSIERFHVKLSQKHGDNPSFISITVSSECLDTREYIMRYINFISVCVVIGCTGFVITDTKTICVYSSQLLSGQRPDYDKLDSSWNINITLKWSSYC